MCMRVCALDVIAWATPLDLNQRRGENPRARSEQKESKIMRDRDRGEIERESNEQCEREGRLAMAVAAMVDN